MLCLLLLADSVFHGFTGLESRNTGRFNLDLFTSAGIPAYAGCAVAYYEGTKAGENYFPFGRQPFVDRISSTTISSTFFSVPR